MATSPLNILPVEEVPPSPQSSPDSPRRRTGKKRGRPKGKKNRPRASKPLPVLSEASAAASPTPATSAPSISEPARAAEFERQTAAVPEVIGELASSPAPAPGPGLPGESPEELIEPPPEHDFHAIAQEYLPKVFNILAAIFGDHWKLRAVEEKILVPECAGSIEELWPWLSKVFDGVRFPKTCAFGVALSIPVMVRIMEERKIRAEARKLREPEKRDPLKPAPDSTAPATATPGSAGSSGSSGSRDAASPTVWPHSSTIALGSSS